MKTITRRTIKLAALSAVLMSSPVFADEPSDTKGEIAALKLQVDQLMQKIDQISAKQQVSATDQMRLNKIEQQIAVTPALAPPVASGVRGITGRIAGVDVRVFGSFDAYYEHQQTGGGTVNRLVSSGSGYTQLGFAAIKDIGQDLHVFGDVHLAYQADNGATNSTVRTFNIATVGLNKDGWGTIQGGRMGTQPGEVLSTFGLIRVGTGNFIYNPFTLLTHDNVIKYTSPTFSHVTLAADVELGEAVGNQTTGRSFAGSAKYDDGKTVGIGGVFSSAAPVDISTPHDKVTIYSLGASHNFDYFKPFVVMQMARSSLQPQSLNQTGWYLGVDVPMGPGKLRLETEMVKNKAWTNANATSANIRYDWLLDVGTTLYFTYTKIWADKNVYYPIVGTGGFAAVAHVDSNALNPSFNTSLNGQSPSALGVGIKFDF